MKSNVMAVAFFLGALLFLAGACQGHKKEKQEEEKASVTAATTNASAPDAEIPADVFSTYSNNRFGFSVLYPKDFVEQPAPTNNDGRVFKSADGEAELTAYGSWNMETLGIGTLRDDYESTQTRLVEEENTKINASRIDENNREYTIEGTRSDGREVRIRTLWVDELNISVEYVFNPTRKAYAHYADKIAASLKVNGRE